MIFLKSNSQVDFQYESNTSPKKYNLIISECSDDLINLIKTEIQSKTKRKKIISYEIDDMPGINILLDDKNLIAKNKIEDFQSKMR